MRWRLDLQAARRLISSRRWRSQCPELVLGLRNFNPSRDSLPVFRLYNKAALMHAKGRKMRIQTVNLCLIILCCTFAAMSGTAAANERGEKIFRRCQACHTLEDGGHESRGPNLHGLFGRKAGTKAGYTFSNAFEASDVTWTEKTLDQFLAEPRPFIPGNKMVFPAIRKPEDRANLIAYLREATK